jgi:hypothetical protein
MRRSFIRCLFIAIAVISFILAASCEAKSEVTVEGTVFGDLDADGTRDAGEAGIPDILVSNGMTVTVTDEGGNYQIPEEGDFVFITIPNDYIPTTPWYRGITGRDFDFGLGPAPEKNRDEFVFVQITDIHIDTEQDHIAIFEQAIDEINDIAPAFVIATGDLVLRGDEVTVSQAREWFDTYATLIQDFEMPIYNVIGNHDVVGIHCEQAAQTEPGYNEEMYRGYFGPTYYSFDWGQYHFLVLDPNDLVDGQQVFRIPDSQLEWLRQDLAYRPAEPLLVFFHEPTPSWDNRTEVLNLLKQRQAMMFCGHWHFDILMDSYGIPEQATSAICAEWWLGPSADGKPFGYRIIDIDGEAISTLYKAIGEERVIDITSPGAIASGEIELTAQLYGERGAIKEAYYSVDSGKAVAMQIEEGAVWDTATALWDTTQLAAGYHTIAVEAKDEEGTFSHEIEVKVSEDEIVPIAELISHFEAYHGQYATVKGEVTFVAMGPPFAEEGTGAIVMSDETGGMVIVTGECIAPLPPHLAIGDLIEVKALPIQYTMEAIAMSNEFDMIWQYAYLLPEELLVGDEAEPQAVRIMRMLSGDDIKR